MSWLINKEEWNSLYSEIKRRIPQLNFSRDQQAADLLSEIISSTGRGLELPEFLEAIRGRENAVVVGCAEGAYGEAAEYLAQQCRDKVLVVAADGATRILLELGVTPDLVVTDLDGDMGALLSASEKGAITVIHAHGDNINYLQSTRLFQGRIVGSTQVEPRPWVHNFGGFTDGDRALFILYHAGYRRIHLAGFNLDKPSVCPGKVGGDPVVKGAKLSIARLLFSYLESKGVKLLSIGDRRGGPGR